MDGTTVYVRADVTPNLIILSTHIHEFSSVGIRLGSIPTRQAHPVRTLLTGRASEFVGALVSKGFTMSQDQQIASLIASGYLELGKFQLAEQHAKAAGAKFPHEGLIACGHTALARGAFEDALSALTAAGDVASLSNLGRVALENANLDIAHPAFAAAGDKDGLLAVANAFQAADKLENATRLFIELENDEGLQRVAAQAIESKKGPKFIYRVLRAIKDRDHVITVGTQALLRGDYNLGLLAFNAAEESMPALLAGVCGRKALALGNTYSAVEAFSAAQDTEGLEAVLGHKWLSGEFWGALEVAKCGNLDCTQDALIHCGLKALEAGRADDAHLSFTIAKEMNVPSISAAGCEASAQGRAKWDWTPSFFEGFMPKPVEQLIACARLQLEKSKSVPTAVELFHLAGVPSVTAELLAFCKRQLDQGKVTDGVVAALRYSKDRQGLIAAGNLALAKEWPDLAREAYAAAVELTSEPGSGGQTGS